MPHEWELEPDSEEFTLGNLKCLLLRGPMKHWCGYVGLPHGHPYYGRYDVDEIRVHWGITYSSGWHPRGKEDDYWWLGFDCAHSGDYCPKDLDYGRLPTATNTYKNMEYARNELRQMAQQALDEVNLPHFGV